MEKSDEIKGAGNSYTAEFWEYDPRLAYRWNQDPIELVGESPYSVFLGNPIFFNDPSGDCPTCPKEAKDGDTHTWGGKSFEYSGGQWSTPLPDVEIAIPKTNSDPGYKEAAETLGQEGLADLKEDIYQAKIASTNTTLHRGIWGQDGQGNVVVPDEFKKRFRQEAEQEAIPAFKAAWAMQQSGQDPSSFNYFVNPLARVAYLRARARAVTSRQEGFSLVTEVGFSVALQYVGRISLLKNEGTQVKFFTQWGQSNNGFTVLKVKDGKSFRVDFDTKNWLHYHRRVKAPDGTTVPGQGISRHRPWEGKGTDKSFFERF